MNERVSVIVPVYNDPDGLEATLESLLDQTDEDYEVIVVDNASTDGTGLLAKRYATEYERVIYETETDVQSSYAARNRGIERASGSILAFIDADVTVSEDWVESARDEMQDNDVRYLACRVNVHPTKGGTFVERYEMVTAFPVERYVESYRFGVTAGLIVTRDLIDEVGPFDSSLVSGGDVEFGNRVHEHGETLHIGEGLTVNHPARSSVRSVLRKAIRVGTGNAHRSGGNGDGSAQGLWTTIKEVLPSRPRTFRTRIRANDIPRSELYAFWAFDYLLTLVMYAATVIESVRMRIR